MSVKLARISKNLTQSRLREILKQNYDIGISPNTLVQIEKGDIENIKFYILISISKALDTPFEELFLKK